MKRSLALLSIAAISAIFLTGMVQAEPTNVGAKKCKMCHMSASRGAQFKKWQEGPHSKAYEALASDAAKETAAGQGIDNPQESEKCLKCHITTSDFKEDGVGCESCHGPGSDYKSMSIMKDKNKSIANGLIIPDENTCKKCHNEESPNFKGFDFEEYSAKIDHSRP